MQITAQIQSAVPRVITKRDGQQITLYEVFVNGQAFVAKKPVFDQASMMVGQIVQLNTRTETNERGYTNNYLDSLVQGQQTQQAPQAQQQPQYHPAPTQPTEQPTTRDRQIWRQTATKVAAHLSSGEPEHAFWRNVDVLVHFYETGQKPSSNPVSSPHAPQQPQENFSQNQYPADEGIPF